MEPKRCLGCMEVYDASYTVCPHCGYVEGTPADEAVHMEPGTILEGRYVIGRVLGYGGFGATYIAWDPVLEQKVAIKEYLPSEFSTRMPGVATVTVFGGDRSEQFHEGMEKFVEEAKRLSKFQNEQGIVKIFDSFQANATAYIVMEYLDGETLTSYLEREGLVPEEKVLSMLMPVMQSLQVVHEEGLLHRDIAPDNIFITKEGNVKLIDFGASRYATTSHSRSLTVIIKPGYSPEEQYRSHGDQGPHTDVYALAAVMYKMLTGVTPPDALERRAMIETKKKELLQDVHKKAKYVSPTMENAVLNAMNIQISDRTADIRSFLGELQAPKPVKRRYGKIKKVDVYAWPLWLKIVIPAVLAASVATGVLLATGVIDFPSLFSGKVVVPEGMTEVPNVEGMASDEAMQTLQNAGLTPVPKGNVESSYVEPGLILLQNPSGGAFAKTGAEIYLTVSSGAEVKGPVNGIATVPYVVWNTQADAEAKLQKAGLKAKVTTVYDDTVAAGMVISQSMETNQQTPVDTEIALVISLGKENAAETQPETQPQTQPETQPPETQPPVSYDGHADGCPFKNGANAELLAHEAGKTQVCYLGNDGNYWHFVHIGTTQYGYGYTSTGRLLRETKGQVIKGAWVTSEYDRQYDENGNLTSRSEGSYEFDSQWNRTSVITCNYGPNGNLLKRDEMEYYPEEKTKRWYHMEYGDAGNISFGFENNYDIAGNEVLRITYGAGGVIQNHCENEYNSAGVRIKQTSYSYDSTGKMTAKVDSEFDSSGTLKKTTQYSYDSDGNTTGQMVWEYDSAERLIATTNYNAAGAIEIRYEYEYNSAGKVIKSITYHYEPAGTFERKEVTEYDPSGNSYSTSFYNPAGIIEHRNDYEIDSSGNLITRTVYQYDSSGNLTRKTVYDADNNVIG